MHIRSRRSLSDSHFSMTGMSEDISVVSLMANLLAVQILASRLCRKENTAPNAAATHIQVVFT